jgi:hypothetical protein
MMLPQRLPLWKKFEGDRRIKQGHNHPVLRFTNRVEQAFRPAAKPLKNAGLQPLRFVFP